MKIENLGWEKIGGSKISRYVYGFVVYCTINPSYLPLLLPPLYRVIVLRGPIISRQIASCLV